MADHWKSAATLLLLLFSWHLMSCRHSPGTPETTGGPFTIREFNPVANWPEGKVLSLDYNGAMAGGFVIPSPQQLEGGLFRVTFKVKNTGAAPRKLAWKIFYQNESYKFPECDPADTTKEHPNAWENFYGSWEDVSKSFEITGPIEPDGEFHAVEGSFRIVGNPRNEERYFENGRNDRWKRNPRVGNYSFLLVALPADIADQTIPLWIRNIGQKQGSVYVNPFYYFRFGPGRTSVNTLVQHYPQMLKVVASPDPGAGIYLNPVAYSKEDATAWKQEGCGQDDNLYNIAQFEQFVHYVDPSTKMNNIPVIRDILNEEYTRLDYNWNRRFYRKEELVAITATTPKKPCETVVSDPVTHKITMRNPRSEFGKWQKQNVGVITRHGMTYGKWTAKCKLTELLNRHNMWNGLTNAIWLITQSQAEWNYRRDCNKEGYMANYYGGQQDQRVKNVGYSEIDFEILKTVPYCPNWVLPPAYYYGIDDQHDIRNWNVPFPEEVLADDDKITVSCTNWDMACWQPASFTAGCYPVRYENKTFWAHRWDNSYRALTQKTPERDDELFASPWYYFQIDWQPDKIIWRIGPSRDQLRVVGYMDDQVTSIPNNQMLLIITQEFHNTKWWIGSAYSQDNVPFPGRDYVGEIFEVTIE